MRAPLRSRRSRERSTNAKGELMNFYYEKYRTVAFHVDYAGPLFAFIRGERRTLRVDYAGPLVAFLRSA